MRRVGRHRGRILVVLVAALVMLGAPTAGAVPGDPPSTPPPASAESELVLSGLGPATSLPGRIAPLGSGFSPTLGYPSAPDPTWDALNTEGRRILATADPAEDGAILVYCIDLRTETTIGYGYRQGSWDAANVPLVGYVARILELYYPNTALPAGLTNDERAAAVQAAIWFFTDEFVLNQRAALRPAVAGIVAAVLAAGPVVEPTTGLEIASPGVDFPAGSPAGPFVATATAGDITVSSADATISIDAAGTEVVPDGSTVATGTPLWLRADDASDPSATLNASAVVSVPSGNVYLYDGNDPNVPTAQKLILATTGSVRSTASASAAFFAAGVLQVQKVIAGPAAGRQGAVTVAVSCDGTPLESLVVPAGSVTGAAQVYPGLRGGAECTVTEPENGAVDGIDVRTALPDPVTVVAGTTVTAQVGNTYAAVAPPTTTVTVPTTVTTTATATTTATDTTTATVSPTSQTTDPTSSTSSTSTSSTVTVDPTSTGTDPTTPTDPTTTTAATTTAAATTAAATTVVSVTVAPTTPSDDGNARHRAELAATGVHVRTAAMIGLCLLLAGGVLCLVLRRRGRPG